jgi:hypothetical protein
MDPSNIPAAAPRRFAAWIVVLGAVAIPLVYLPTLGTRFDFIDDGNLVYPAPPMPVGERLHLVWEKIVANYEHLGPFRPVLWVHWEIAAELFRADPLKWHLARLLWSGVAIAALLALLRELRLRPAAALFVAAVALWNPYRNEIWTSLTLSEGVAMPYALAALWCAARANRSARAWPWDLASALGVFAALGCKNVFAALIPVQVYLRMYADGADWRTGLRQHWKRAALLCFTLLMPIVHYVYYRLHWHPGQYPPTGPTWAQFGRLVRSVVGAESIEYIALGLAIAFTALLLTWRAGIRPLAQFSTPLIAGAMLLAAGMVVYLPIPAISGRYTMPAVWGLDLILAALLSGLALVSNDRWRRTAWVALGVGLAAVAVTSVGKQERFAARAAVLWEALEYVEQHSTPADRVAWYDGPALNVEEGIHFRWHLLARGHDLPVDLYDEHGKPQERCELPPAAGGAGIAVTGAADAPPGGPWELRRSFKRTYWGDRHEYDCYVWGIANGG